MRIVITEKQQELIKKEVLPNLKKEVFLGGTANNSNWRNELIPLLNINYFNPIVDDWNEGAQKKEIEKRRSCDYLLYVITPEMEGIYSICECIEDSIKQSEKTIFSYIDNDSKRFSEHQVKSFEMMKKMVIHNGAKAFDSLEEIADYLNKNS